MDNELVAREFIRTAIADYCIAMDRGTMNGLLDIFAPDAGLEMYGYSAVGHDQILKTLGKTGRVVMSVPGITPLRHFLSTQSVHVHSACDASSTTYVTVVGAHGVDHWGAYLDRWRNDGDRWRITQRTIALDGFNPGSAGERLHAATVN